MLVERPNLMEHVPRSPLRDLYVPCQLAGGDALLVGGHEVHRHEPLAKREVGVLEYRAHLRREGVFARRALETVVLAGVDMRASAIRTDNRITPSLLGEEHLAGVFVHEVVGEGDERVEVRKIHHIAFFKFTS